MGRSRAPVPGVAADSNSERHVCSTCCCSECEHVHKVLAENPMKPDTLRAQSLGSRLYLIWSAQRKRPQHGEETGAAIHRMLWGHYIRSPITKRPNQHSFQADCPHFQEPLSERTALAPDQLDQAMLYFEAGLSI